MPSLLDLKVRFGLKPDAAISEIKYANNKSKISNQENSEMRRNADDVLHDSEKRKENENSLIFDIVTQPRATQNVIDVADERQNLSAAPLNALSFVPTPIAIKTKKNKPKDGYGQEYDLEEDVIPMRAINPFSKKLRT